MGFLDSFLKSDKLIGLDIGSSSIKLAEIDINGKSATLSSFAYLTTPAGAINNGEIVNVNSVTDTIKTLVSKSKTKRKEACVGLLGSSVIVKKITMPKIEKKLLAQQVAFEAEQYIPFDPQEISLSYSELKANSGVETMDIMLVAAQNQIVNQFISTVSGAGLKLAILDVCGFALANAFEFNYGVLNGKTIALLSIGAMNSHFVIVSNGEVIFSRDIPYGGVNYSIEIHKEMGVTIPEAEALKMSAIVGGEVPEQVHTIIGNVSEQLAEEVKNSFEFFAASSPGFPIEHCFYTGGGSGMPNLISLCGSTTGIGFELINPFKNIKPGSGMNEQFLQQIAPIAAIAVGLAIRKSGDN